MRHRSPAPVRSALALALLVMAGCRTAGEGSRPAGDGPSAEPLPTVAAATAGLATREGLLRVHLDEDGGRLLAELPPPTGPRGEVARLLVVDGLRTGVGSNPVGLDRGELGEARLVVLRRLGRRVLVEAPNLRYRARTGEGPARRAAEESFATSVLWAGPLLAEDTDGRGLVDLAPFVVRDAHSIADTLRRTGQGAYELDPERSLLDVAACHVFPDNLALEAVLTFAGSEPGAHVRSTVPVPAAITVVAHQMWLRLPDDGYRPRVHDPRAGAFAIDFHDAAAPLDAPVVQRLAVRHRLGRGAPPIVYHVDRGAPPAVREALLEGARWWEEAFAAAGFPGGFRVELLPEDVHPLDARYHVIQWVHRATRGWSYGHALVDPRTGEILKGHVTLGALRVRQDRLLFEGLLGTARTGQGGPRDPLALALARIRQLAAHEVGHTLGLAHNFAASATVANGSVMDYPAPDVHVGGDGELDTSAAYGTGVGPWDVQAIRWLYGDHGTGEAERAALAALLAEETTPDGRPVPPFLSDGDARPAGAAHPLANLWDNGPDPVAALADALAVRRLGLARFDATRVAPGRPLATLQEVLAPVYFHHRYQLEAAVKVVGGRLYEHAVAGDGRTGVRDVDAGSQREALAAVLATLDPAVLDLPDGVLALLLPRPPGWEPSRELFAGGTAPAFDPLAAAATAAEMAVAGLLQVERAGRLVDQHRRDPALPGLDEVLEALVEATFGRAVDSPREAALTRVVQHVVVGGLLALASDPRAAPWVAGRAEAGLRRLADRLEGAPPDDEGADHHRALVATIRRHLERGRIDDAPPPSAPPPPPGSPIGLPTLGGCGAAPR